MAVFKCAGRRRGYCNYEAPARWRGPCPVELGGCGRLYDCEKYGSDDDPEKRSKRSAANFTHKKRKWFSTGMREVDKVLGEDKDGTGMVIGCTVVLGGLPGSGKSTLAIQICDSVAQAGFDVLYVSNEQSADRIGDILRRTKCTHERIQIVGNEGDVYKIMDDAKASGVKLLVIDSMQAVRMNDCDGVEGSNAQTTAVADYVTSYTSREEKFVTILISQMNKEADIAGSMKAQHAIDTIAYLDRDEEFDEDGEEVENSPLRVLSSGKNRNGAEGVKQYFKLTETGLHPIRNKKSKLYGV